MTDFLDLQKALYPDISQKYDEFNDLYNRRLWHQLSISLESFLNDISNKRDDNYIKLYDEFISKFEARLSPTHLAQLVSIIGHSYDDNNNALNFFNKVLNARTRLGLEASLCIDMDVVLVKLKVGMTDEVKVMLDEAKTKLATISSNETIVYSKFYRSQSEYLKCVGPPQDFYKAALMFLAYTPVESLPQAQKYMLATDMALASITGDDIFNFGEVIATPILNCLQGTPNEWLRELVFALNKGDIDGFNTIVDTYSKQYFAQPFLAAKHEFVKRKIVLLCLMNIAFEKHSHVRTLTFASIAARTKIPVDQVEWVLMKAMSLGLIKGSIDEVEQTVSITWVQPRVLDKEQLSLVRDQIDDWTKRVKSAVNTMKDQTAELLA